MDRRPSSLLGESRRDAGLTQEELAERTGLTVRSISNIERGRVARPRRHSVEALALGLGLQGEQASRFVRHYCPDAVSPPRTPVASVPAQLPSGITSFIGRQREIDALDALLGEGDGGGVVVAVLEGMAGVGKTSLAVQWAQRVKQDFPDGQLFANLRGYGPGAPADPGEVLRSFLRALGVPVADVPADLDDRAASLRSELAGRSVLIVLDNARSADQVRPLLPGHAGCAVVVTSRSALHGLTISADAHRVPVPLLTEQESFSLLDRLAGAGRRFADRTALADMVSGCGGLPLALRIVGERLAHNRNLANVASSMRPAGNRLAALTTEEKTTSLPSVLSWSYDALPADVASALRLLGLHPGPHWDIAAAAALLGTDPPETGRLLDALVDSHLLLTHRADERFEFHDLVRDYARGRADEEPAQRRSAALRRLAEHCVAGAADAAGSLTAGDPNRRPLLTPITENVRFTGAEDAAAWLAAELPTLIAIAEQSSAVGDTYARDLSTVLWQALRVHGHYGALRTLHRLALTEAQRAGDAIGTQQALVDLAAICARLGHFDEAVTHLTRCLDVDGSRVVAGRALNILGTVNAQLGRYTDAAEHLSKAVTVSQETGDRLNEGRSLSNLGFMHLRQGDAATARLHQEAALDIAVATGIRPLETLVHNGLADSALACGDRPSALAHYTRAAELARLTREPHEEARALTGIAATHDYVGAPDKARPYRERARSLYEAMGIAMVAS